MTENYPDYAIMFTDGSKSTAAGCAVTTETTVIVRYSLPQSFSILSSELRAIELAADIAVNSRKDTLICSDSLSSLHSLKNFHARSQHPIAKSIVSILLRATSRVVFVWVPGHRGISGNELADLAAKEAATCFPAPLISVPSLDFANFVKSSIQRKWDETWQSLPSSNKLRSIRASPLPWTTSQRRNRKEEVVLSRLRIGHAQISHSYLLSKMPRTSCDHCQIPISVCHILIECPKYSQIRSLLHLPSSLPKLLADNENSVTRLFQFLKLTGLYLLI